MSRREEGIAQVLSFSACSRTGNRGQGRHKSAKCRLLKPRRKVATQLIRRANTKRYIRSHLEIIGINLAGIHSSPNSSPAVQAVQQSASLCHCRLLSTTPKPLSWTARWYPLSTTEQWPISSWGKCLRHKRTVTPPWSCSLTMSKPCFAVHLLGMSSTWKASPVFWHSHCSDVMAVISLGCMGAGNCCTLRGRRWKIIRVFSGSSPKIKRQSRNASCYSRLLDLMSRCLMHNCRTGTNQELHETTQISDGCNLRKVLCGIDGKS